MRIENILNSARLTLADKSKQRFSDEDLIVFLNQGLQDFCQRTKFLNSRTTVRVKKDDIDIQLPSEIIYLTRALWENKVLSFLSIAELDNSKSVSKVGDFFTHYNSNYPHSDSWESDVGEPEAVVWNNRVNNLIRLYPLAKEELFLEKLTSSFGVVTDSRINTDPFGVLSYKFGLVTAVKKELELDIYYVKTHSNVTSINDELETAPMHDVALQHFICCQAFLANLDNQYTEKATLQRQLYDQYVQRVSIEVSMYWTRNKQYRTPYRRGV